MSNVICTRMQVYEQTIKDATLSAWQDARYKDLRAWSQDERAARTTPRPWPNGTWTCPTASRASATLMSAARSSTAT